MKNVQRIVCVVLSFVLVFSPAMLTYADSQPISISQTNSDAVKVSWDDLPNSYQDIVDKSAVIYKNADGTFDIYQKYSLAPSTRSLERYEPTGGTFSRFSNSSYGGSKIIRLVYQTYVPANVVGKYLIQNKSTTLSSAKQWVVAFGISTALTMIANKFGIRIKGNTLNLAISTAIVYYSSYNYNQMLSASGGGQYGVQIDYITTMGAGNARIYSKWGGAPYVPSLPNRGTATWLRGQYYAKP